MSISEQFKDFWGTYGQFIGLFAGGFVGAYAKMLFDKRKRGMKRMKEERINLLTCLFQYSDISDHSNILHLLKSNSSLGTTSFDQHSLQGNAIYSCRSIL